jgi:hypothetical protein
VAAALSGMGLEVQEEVVDEVSGYSLDIVLDATSPMAPQHAAQSKAGWAVEVDGPSHFVKSSDGRLHPNGGTILKRRHLEALGYALVSVPFWQWNGLKKGEREGYLREKLGLITRER